MPIAGRTANSPMDARSLEAGALLIGAGALLLFISLFLDWYQPGLEAWTVFEAWDLVLALLAVAALVAVAGRMGFGPRRPASWLIVPALAALIIVVYAIHDPPPATAGLPDGDPTTGLWLALVGSILMALGALLSFARISVNISASGPAPHRHHARSAGRRDPARPDRRRRDRRSGGRGRRAGRRRTGLPP